MKKENTNELTLMGLCIDSKQSINSLAKVLEITPGSVSNIVKKLETEGKLIVTRGGRGRKTYVRTKEGIKERKYMIRILEKIKERGNISFKEYTTTPDLYFGCEDYSDKSSANFAILYSNPPLIRRTITLTEEGEKYLKEHKPEKSNICNICGRPIKHKGNCMACNIKLKEDHSTKKGKS